MSAVKVSKVSSPVSLSFIFQIPDSEHGFMQSFGLHEKSAYAAASRRASWRKLKIAREGERIELAAVGRVIIFAPAPYRSEPGGAIHGRGRISVADFEMHSLDTVEARAFDEIFKQIVADPAPALAWKDRQQQKLGLAGDAP